MKCKICGGEIPEGLSVCPICGISVEASESAAEAAAKAMTGQGTGSSYGMTDSAAKASAGESGGSAAPKNKYQIVGEVGKPSNPFGMDPNNKEAREAQAEAMKNLEMEARILDDEPEEIGRGGGFSGFGGGSGIISSTPRFQGVQNGPAPGASPYGTPFDSTMDPDSQPVQPPYPAPQAKSNNNLTLWIIIGGAVVALIVVLFATGLLGKNHGADGTYRFYSAKAYDRELTAADFKQMGMDVSDFALEIDGSTAILSFLGRKGKASVEFDKTKVTFDDAKDVFEGTYSSIDETISIEMDGVVLIFKKN